MGDKCGQASLVDSAATQKPHIGEYLITAVGDLGIARQMVLADPDQPVGMDRATTKRRCLFEHDRLQAKFVGSERASQSGDA
jgi:hypothetical protein